jgi:hypothetical protein
MKILVGRFSTHVEFQSPRQIDLLDFGSEVAVRVKMNSNSIRNSENGLRKCQLTDSLTSYINFPRNDMLRQHLSYYVLSA